MEARNTSQPSGAENFRMIDVGAKEPTRRRAVAQGRITMAPSTLALVRTRTLPKGDVLALAEVAGILAAKRTSEIIPLCHPLPLDAVHVRCEAVGNDTVEVTCEVITTAKTGVEMEALTGVSAALLTVYDLAKAVDPVLEISDIFLRTKEGGKSGDWAHPRLAAERPEARPGAGVSLEGIRTAVLTVSDRCARGEAKDASGPTISSFLESRGAPPAATRVVPDEREAIQAAVHGLIDDCGAELVVTTGGTGLGPRDVTPEALREIWTRPVPGVGELLRSSGARHTPKAWLSRSDAGLVGRTLVILLPGSRKAVAEGLEALEPVLRHAVEIVRGGDHRR